MKNKNKSNILLDKIFDQEMKEILELEEERAKGPNPLKKEKLQIEEKIDEILNYDFEK